MCLESSLSTRTEAIILHYEIIGAGRKLTDKRTAKRETQLHIAARRGNLSLVKTLISSGICVNEQDSAGLKILMGLFYDTILYNL